MNIKCLIKSILFSIIVLNCEAKSKDERINIDLLETVPQKAVVQCRTSDNCSNFSDYYPDMAYCNVTSNTCVNYCFVKIPCTSNFDCNYSVGDSKKCDTECYKNNVNDTIGECLVVSKQGQYCNDGYIICEGDLVCDRFTYICMTKEESQDQSGEPLFSLFLFMLIMLSLFNRQRADEDVLNNMAPNELLMITSPNRRHRPEDDELPTYQPLDSNNEDEIIEQNIENMGPHTLSNNSLSEQNQSSEEFGIVVDDDDLPLLPPTYDEAVSGSAESSQQQVSENNNENHPINHNTCK